jgi:hypothetical protein
MPREFACRAEGCGRYRPVATATGPEDAPACPECGKRMEVVLYALATVFTGPITARYNSPTAENAHMEGHHAWGRDPLTNKPVHRFIESWSDQKKFCSDFNMRNPKEFGNHYEVAEDGKTLKNSIGMPGCEV